MVLFVEPKRASKGAQPNDALITKPDKEIMTVEISSSVAEKGQRKTRNGTRAKYVQAVSDYGVHTSLHRIIMERHIGRKLESDEVVHHINGRKKDNRLKNLKLMSLVDHVKLHRADPKRKMSESIARSGESGNLAKLKDHQIPLIRVMYKLGMCLEGISEMFGVRKESVSAAARGISWKYCSVKPVAREDVGSMNLIRFLSCSKRLDKFLKDHPNDELSTVAIWGERKPLLSPIELGAFRIKRKYGKQSQGQLTPGNSNLAISSTNTSSSR